MLRIVGNSDDAIASYEKCTAVRPEFSDAWWGLASLKDYRLSDEQVQTIRSQIASDDLGVNSEIAMRFALARTSEATRGIRGSLARLQPGQFTEARVD